MSKLSERYMYYCGLLASFNYDSGVKVDDLKHIQNLIDKEEQGLLIELPCKVGDTLYLLYPQWNENEQRTEKVAYPYLVKSLDWIVEHEKYIGKTLFLTRSEAEEALERMGGK